MNICHKQLTTMNENCIVTTCISGNTGEGDTNCHLLEVHVIDEFLVLVEAVATNVDEDDDTGEEDNTQNGQGDGHNHFSWVIHVCWM